MPRSSKTKTTQRLCVAAASTISIARLFTVKKEKSDGNEYGNTADCELFRPMPHSILDNATPNDIVSSEQ